MGVKVVSGSVAASSTNTGPNYVTTTTVYLPSGTNTGVYTAQSVAPAGTTAGTIVVASPAATAPCANQGYLTQQQIMYVVDIATGGYSQVVNWQLGGANSGLTINALGYNTLDKYLYGVVRGVFPETFARLSFDGVVQNILNLANDATIGRYYIGDIDTNGQYYTAAQTQGGSVINWRQINLNPTLKDYG